MILAIWITTGIGLALALTAVVGLQLINHRQAALPLAESDKLSTDHPVRLSQAHSDQPLLIAQLDEKCTGHARRRILDLGLTRGARLKRELDGPFGGMSAYRVRGTLIALRDDQADHIWVTAAGH